MSAGAPKPRGGSQPGGGSSGRRGPIDDAARIRGPGAKVNALAARMLKAGHPWVFSESLLRPLAGVDVGQRVRVDDEDGFPVGWGLADPAASIAVRMIGLGKEVDWDAERVEARIRAAVLDRERRLGSGARDCRRLVHAEGDSLPGVAVDRLGEHLLIYKYATVVDSYLQDVVAGLEAAAQPRGIYLQDRTRPVTPDEPRPAAELVAGKAAPPEIEVDEDGLKFVVDVTAPVSPGLFLDLREGRRWCESLAEGARVLNLFSFTGAFGMRAVRGGATEVVNVDSAARSHARCRQNLAAFGFDPEACEALTGDVFAHLDRLRRKQREFDLVVVDPPPFSRVKSRVFSALRDWSELVTEVASVLAPGGHLLAVSNAVALGDAELLTAVGRGATEAGRVARLVGERGLPRDFPVPPAFAEGRYLKIRLVQLL